MNGFGWVGLGLARPGFAAGFGLGLTVLKTAWLSCARPNLAGMRWEKLRSAGFGSALLGWARLVSAELDCARLQLAGLGWAKLVGARLRWDRLSSAPAELVGFGCTLLEWAGNGLV